MNKEELFFLIDEYESHYFKYPSHTLRNLKRLIEQKEEGTIVLTRTYYQARLVFTVTSDNKEGEKYVESDIYPNGLCARDWITENLKKEYPNPIAHAEIIAREYDGGLIKKESTYYYYEW